MHRFFVPPSWLQGDKVTMSGSIVHQIVDVLRLGPGDSIVVLDDSGWEYVIRISAAERDHVSGLVEQKALSRAEPRSKVTLYQSMLKGHNFEWVLQKGTELGVVEFVPMVSERCVIASLDVSQSKTERWQRIIREAAEQSHRGRLPRLQAPALFPQACERARNADLAILPWEDEQKRRLRSVLAESDREGPQVQGQGHFIRRPFSISVFIGPEGGFAGREIDHALRYGIMPVSLGPRILRAESAALVATTMVLYQLGDL